MSCALDGWTYLHAVQLVFIDPGKPVQNAHVESFNGKVRDEFLNEHWFASIAEAPVLAEAYRIDFNTVRPHSSLDYLTPAEFVQRTMATAPATPAPRPSLKETSTTGGVT